MLTLDQFIDDQLAQGRGYFSRAQVDTALGMKPQSLTAALTRRIKVQQLANPRQDFYLILRPEDRVSGAPDPARWIDALMRHQAVDYRISLLRAASFHGAAHQAAMVFQVVVSSQQRPITLGRHRIQFVYQSPAAFTKANSAQSLEQLKTDTGYAKIAGPELTLLDCMRYFHQAGGLGGVAQIVKDMGGRASPTKLYRLAKYFDTTTARRLGYLLEKAGCQRQADALEPIAKAARTVLALDPSVQDLAVVQSVPPNKDAKWKLFINDAVEFDF